MVIVNHTSPPAGRRGLHLPACGETRTSPPRSRGDADFTSPLAGRSAAQPPGGDVNYTSPRAGRRGLHLPARGEVGGAAAGWGREVLEIVRKISPTPLRGGRRRSR